MIDFKKEIEVAKEASRISATLLKSDSNDLNEKLFEQGTDIKISADFQSEELIKDYLSNNSDFPILAEESGSNEGLGETFWIVDPLDGTLNYSRNFPIYCISIALFRNNEAYLGVINDFTNDDIYVGCIDSFAVKNDTKIHVSNIAEREKATLATGPGVQTRENDNLFTKRILHDFDEWKKVRLIGSAAMSCAYVASGIFDQYHEKGVYLWDVAAGLAIIKAAGGSYSLEKNEKDLFKVNVSANNGII